MTDEQKKILLSEIGKLSLTAQEALRELLKDYDKSTSKPIEFTKEELKFEIWRNITGYEGLYQISTLGRVKSFHNDGERILKLQISSGYYRVNLNKNGSNKNFRVHILVAKAFIPNPENKPVVNHKDLNTMNCRVDNLEWSTYSENTKHAWDNGATTSQRGVHNSQAKLTEEAVKYIRQNPDKMTLKQLAEKFHMGTSSIHRAQLHQTYKDIT